MGGDDGMRVSKDDPVGSNLMEGYFWYLSGVSGKIRLVAARCAGLCTNCVIFLAPKGVQCAPGPMLNDYSSAGLLDPIFGDGLFDGVKFVRVRKRGGRVVKVFELGVKECRIKRRRDTRRIVAHGSSRYWRHREEGNVVVEWWDVGKSE
jgi:hypothetical protein